MARATYSFTDRELQRTAEGEADAAILIADGQAYTAADEDGAWRQFVALAEFLTKHLQPSSRWQVCCLVLAHAQAAESLDRRSTIMPRQLNSPTDMLELVREELGDDAWARVRQLAADRMTGRR
jgi:hypothetical protein